MMHVFERAGCYETSECGNCGHVIHREFPIVDTVIQIQSPGLWFHTLSLFRHCDAARSKEARPA